MFPNNSHLYCYPCFQTVPRGTSVLIIQMVVNHSNRRSDSMYYTISQQPYHTANNYTNNASHTPLLTSFLQVNVQAKSWEYRSHDKWTLTETSILTNKQSIPNPFPLFLLTSLSQCVSLLHGIILFFDRLRYFGQTSMNQTPIVVATGSCSLLFDVYLFLEFL